jgi:hypothetical protein
MPRAFRFFRSPDAGAGARAPRAPVGRMKAKTMRRIYLREATVMLADW